MVHDEWTLRKSDCCHYWVTQRILWAMSSPEDIVRGAIDLSLLKSVEAYKSNGDFLLKTFSAEPLSLTLVKLEFAGAKCELFGLGLTDLEVGDLIFMWHEEWIVEIVKEATYFLDDPWNSPNLLILTLPITNSLRLLQHFWYSTCRKPSSLSTDWQPGLKNGYEYFIWSLLTVLFQKSFSLFNDWLIDFKGILTHLGLFCS